MPRKKETTIAEKAKAVEAVEAVEAKSTTKQTTASKTTKTSKNVSPSLSTSAKTTTETKATKLTPKVKKEVLPKPKTITRRELTQEVAKAVGQYMEITNWDAEEIVSEIINSMINALKSGDEIEIRKFGAFRIRTRNARNGRNPKNGMPVKVPSKSVVFFKMGRELKEGLLKS